MAIKIRLARAGTKKRPFYHIVAADSRMPRDGRFLERLGSYNPLLPKDSEDRVKLDLERAKEWIAKGAQPTDRISRFLESAGVVAAKSRANPKKAEPGEKAQKRAEERAKKAEAVKEKPAAPAEAAEAPAESSEAPAEASEAPAEATEATAEAPAETAQAEASEEAKTE